MLAVVSDFASEAECDQLTDLVQTALPMMHAPRAFSLEVAARTLGPSAPLNRIRGQILDHLRHLYGDDLLPEYTLLAVLDPGGSIPEHADNVVCAAGDWVPNHTPQRAATALLYFSDFEGGAIHHPFVGTTFQPTRGSLVSFPCDGHYKHYVTPVTSGRRFSLALWTTRDPAYAEPWGVA